MLAEKFVSLVGNAVEVDLIKRGLFSCDVSMIDTIRLHNKSNFCQLFYVQCYFYNAQNAATSNLKMEA